MTVRTWWSAALGLGLLMTSSAVASAQELKLAFINLDKVFTEYHKTQSADLKLKEQAEEFKDEAQQLDDEYQKLETDFNALRDEAQNTALSEEARNSKRDEAEAKLVEMRESKSKIRRFLDTRRKQLDDQQRRMRKDLVDEITGIIEDYSRDKGYTAVLDSSGQSLNGVPSILYADHRLDLTDDVITLLNKDTKKE